MKNYRLLPVLGIMIISLVGGGLALCQIMPAKSGDSIIVGEPSGRGNVVTSQGIGFASEAAIDLSEGAVTYTGILRSIDERGKEIGVYLQDEAVEKKYSYNTITSVKTAKGQETVMESLPMGSLVEITVMKGSEDLLLSVQSAEGAWDYTNVKNLTVDQVNSVIMIGERKYKYDYGVLSVFSGHSQISLDDLNPEKDILDVKGIGKKVLSINVTKGHGILDFKNYDDFIGGNIEVGYRVFDTISGNMKYTLPEGTYKVRMSNGGLAVNKVVKVERFRTTMLDLSEYTASMTKKSIVRFNLAPYDAQLYIDGQLTDTSVPHNYEYGEYLVKAVCDGYKDYSSVLKIKKAKQEINISLVSEEEAKEEPEDKKEEKDNKKTDNSETDNTENLTETTKTAESEKNAESTDNAETTETKKEEGTSEKEVSTIPVKTDTSKKISFRNPSGTKVSLDGTEIGTIPCETTKVTGEHVITLSKDGYTSQNYTVDIEDDGQDTIFSFPELMND